MTKQLYTTTQAAKIFGVSARTIQIWADSGMIEVTKTVGGHRRISAEEIKRLALKMGKSLADQEAFCDVLDIDADADAVGIMFIDKDSDLLKLYQMQISTWETPRARVYLAHEGYDAMLQIGANKPDVIIVDANLPEVDSDHMVTLIRQKPDFSHCRIIILSSPDDNNAQFNQDLPEDVLFEDKPIAFTRIQQLVSEHLADRDAATLQ
jgi:excisionase family DNA binding protein